MNKRYPKDQEIKVRWTTTHIGILTGISILLIGLIIYEVIHPNLSEKKWLTLIGLYVDMFGVVVASLKTPFYGIFHDAGEIEEKRHKKEVTHFQTGMFMIAGGILLQAISTVL